MDFVCLEHGGDEANTANTYVILNQYSSSAVDVRG